MKNAPIPAVLSLWSLGHSAGWIATALGFPNHKHITRIVANARRLGDPRAVLHASKSGRLIGRAGHRPCLAAVEIVPSTSALACRRGHPQTRGKFYASNGHCRECTRLRNAGVKL